MEAWKVTPGMKFPVEWDQPPFLIPSGEKNAKNINDILKKSWEIQAGSNPNLPDGNGEYPTLVTNSCFQIHGFLKYYFNCLGIIQITKFNNTGLQILIGILGKIRKIRILGKIRKIRILGKIRKFGILEKS